MLSGPKALQALSDASFFNTQNSVTKGGLLGLTVVGEEEARGVRSSIGVFFNLSPSVFCQLTDVLSISHSESSNLKNIGPPIHVESSQVLAWEAPVIAMSTIVKSVPT